MMDEYSSDDNVLPVNFPNHSTKFSQLHNSIRDVVYSENSKELPIVAIIGVLELMKAELINACWED